MDAGAVASVLDDMMSHIATAMAAAERDRAGAVASVLAAHVRQPDLLRGRECPCSEERYVRHVLGEGAGGRYAVAALVWRPGQMSRVHSHRTWCALGVHRGVLTETIFSPAAEPDDVPRPVATLLRHAGDTSHGPADPNAIHRIANLGCEPAISIHVYGVAFENFATDVNEILAP